MRRKTGRKNMRERKELERLDWKTLDKEMKNEEKAKQNTRKKDSKD